MRHGSSPGSTVNVGQRSDVTINFTNQADVETTVHWPGLRLDNHSDGVPHGHHHGMQAPIPVGGVFPVQAWSVRLMTRAPTPDASWSRTAPEPGL
jgi:FtsP/CotA-like multicopper oxidase with cupredoxin domain